MEKKDELLRAAIAAREFACAPYSRFQVGAAFLTASGKIFTGCNVESASFGLTCCAERVGLFKALSEGEKQIVAVAVTAAVPNGPMPCGACRQLLAEYASAAVLYTFDTREPEKQRTFLVPELLPEAFLSFA